MTDPIRVLSFGAGVQSSYVARMSLLGDIPPFDHVIFADTGDEPADVMENVAWWTERFTGEGVKVHVVGLPRSISETIYHCPFHSDAEWRHMRDHQPESWAKAVDLDRAPRRNGTPLRGDCYLHSSLKPLDEVDLSTEEDRGQGTLWGQECEGMCGL